MHILCNPPKTVEPNENAGFIVSDDEDGDVVVIVGLMTLPPNILPFLLASPFALSLPSCCAGVLNLKLLLPPKNEALVFAVAAAIAAPKLNPLLEFNVNGLGSLDFFVSFDKSLCCDISTLGGGINGNGLSSNWLKLESLTSQNS